jgi:hypothetical protein
MNCISLHRTVAIGITAAAIVAAQPPNDNCSDAIPVAGFITVGFDNVGGTTDGPADGLCDFFGSSQIYNDVWYCWTAAPAGPVGVRNCEFTSLDTKIAVYDGCGCPIGLGILACNDDACGLQTVATWTAAAGHSYLIRVGSYNQLAFGSGEIEFYENIVPTLAGPFSRPGSDHTYLLLESSSWSAAEATAIAHGGHLATVNDADENEFLRAGVLGFDGADRRGWIGFNDVALEGTFVWTSGEPITYTNWNAGEPNNSGGAEDATEMFGSNGEWNDNRDTPTGVIVYGLVEIPGDNPCPADLDGNGTVGLGDLTILLSNYGRTDNPGPTEGNLDGDNDVDINDLTLLLSAYGTTCP